MQNAPVNKTRIWTLITLLMAFLAPIGIAWVLYSNKTTIDFHKLNTGNLINPPYEFSKLPLSGVRGGSFKGKGLKGKWILFYVEQAHCESACKKELYHMRQLRIAMGRDADRVGRLFVTRFTDTDPQLSAELKKRYPQMAQARMTQKQFATINSVLRDNKEEKTPDSLYLVDPVGRVMMSYAEGAPPKGIMDDLKRLLKVSQIG